MAVYGRYVGNKKLIDYEYFNVNPKGRKTGDCSTRALALTLNIDYEDALKEQCEKAAKYCFGVTCRETMDKILKEYSYKKMKMPKRDDNTRYRVNEMNEILTKKQMDEGVFISVCGHYTCIKDSKIKDIWDCGYYKVGNYWVLEED